MSNGITVFGHAAECGGEHLENGQHMGVSGRLQFRRWENSRTGHTRTTDELVAECA